MTLLTDINFTPQASPEVIERGKAWLVKNQSQFEEAASFVILNDTEETEKIAMPCHLHISYNNLPNTRAVATECAWHRTHGYDKDATIQPYLNWFLNESYFGRFILNRDDPEFCLKHGFIVSADVWAPLLQNIMIATRAFRETSFEKFEQFASAVSRGIPGNLAWMVIFNTVGGKEDYPVSWAGSGHKTIQSPSLATLLNFLRGDTQVPDSEINDPKYHYTNNKHYIGGTKMFWPNREVPPQYTAVCSFFMDELIKKNVNGFKDALSDYRKDKAASTVYAPPNPFKPRPLGAPPVARPDQVTVKELHDFVLPWLVDTYYEEDKRTLKNARN